MEAILAETPEVEAYGSVTAFAMAGPGLANNAIVFVRLKDKRERKRSVQEIVNGPAGLRAKLLERNSGRDRRAEHSQSDWPRFRRAVSTRVAGAGPR